MANLAKSDTKFLLASGMGTFLEFLDFAIYIAAAPLLTHYFFATTSELASIVFTWAAFATAFLVRPIGAILFGHIGDRMGCKKAMILSIIVMSLSTLGIGCLPGFSSIGYFAPVLLILFRICQGLAVSSEYSGIGVYLSQRLDLAPRFGSLCSITVIATWLGYFVGNYLMSITNMISDATWRWRVPFIATGVIVGVVGSWLRVSMNKGLPEKQVRIPFVSLLKTQKKEIGICMILSGFVGVACYMLLSYFPGYCQKYYGYSLEQAFALRDYLVLITISVTIFSGWLSDKVNRLSIMKVSAVLLLVVTICCLFLKLWFDWDLLMIQFLTVAIVIGLFSGPLPAVLAESFREEQRYTGSAFGHNIGIGWLGVGTAQWGLLLTYQFINNECHILVYCAFFCVAAIVGLTLLSKSHSGITVFPAFQTHPKTS